MNLLVFGSNGFIGKNVIHYFSQFYSVKTAKIDQPITELKQLISEADVIFNAVGVTRSNNENDFFLYNVFYPQKIYDLLSLFQNKTLIYFSSIHFNNENIYGVTKRYNECILQLSEYSANNKILCFRLPNVFGVGAKPNNVSVVSTFCYNIVNGIDSVIVDGTKQLSLLYINELMNLFKFHIEQEYIYGFSLINDFDKLLRISVNDLYSSIMLLNTMSNNEIESLENKDLENLYFTLTSFKK